MPVRRTCPQRCRPRAALAVLAALGALGAVAGCAAPGSTGEPEAQPAFFTGAGDIGECGSTGTEQTARLLDGIPGLVWTVGDNAYPAGGREDFLRCYEPAWGRHRERTRPTPGNHEYWTTNAAPYFEYFGEAAGTPGEGWYSYEYGGWRIIALNSNVDTGPRSPQLRWLRALLADDDHRCTLAYFHHPLISSGAHGDNVDALDHSDVRSLWSALYDARADVVLAGHDHHYERFAPVNPAGELDEARGLRLFIVGTGGGTLRGRGASPHPASEVFEQGRFGVLRLELRPTGYRWAFLTTDGPVLDRGEGVCR